MLELRSGSVKIVLPDARRLGELFGRDTEADRLRELLGDGCPLITVTGLGGIGKTRLVAHVLGDLDATWIDATEAHDAGQLGVTLERLTMVLAGRRRRARSDRDLIVVDSLDAPAAGACIADLLDRNPRLQIVVTSQGRLNLRGETLLRVGPLAHPTESGLDADALDRFPAVHCFLAAARRAEPSFRLDDSTAEPIEKLVCASGGHPLAIELAASWLRALPLDLVVARSTSSLDVFQGGAEDLPARQRDLRTAIGWTLSDSSPADAEIIAAIALTGAVDVDTLELIVGREIGMADLARLADRHVLHVTHEAFGPVVTLHPAVATIASHAPEGPGLRRRLIDTVIEIVERHGPRIDTSGHSRSFEILRRNDGTIGRAVRLLGDDPCLQSEIVLRLIPFWRSKGRPSVARSWCTQLAEAGVDVETTIRLQLASAECARDLGDYDAAERAARRGYENAQRHGDEALLVGAIAELSAVAAGLSAPVIDTTIIDWAFHRCHERGWKVPALRMALNRLTEELRVGNDHSARQLAAEARALAEADHDDSLPIRLVVATWLEASDVELAAHDLETARVMTMRALSLAERLGPTTQTYAIALMQTTRVNEARGEHRQAAHAARSAIAVLDALGAPFDIAQANKLAGTSFAHSGDPDEARRAFLIALRMFRAMEHAFQLADVVTVIALAPHPVGPPHADRAKLLGAVEQQFPGFHDRVSPSWKRAYTAAVHAARRELGSVFDELRHQPISLDAAVAIAEAWLDSGDQLPPAADRVGVSPRELDVLRLLASGLSDRQIAERLVIGVRTVNSHVSALLRKLAVPRRSDAAAWAHQHLPLN